jgi:thiamine kinase-like enzyme
VEEYIHSTTLTKDLIRRPAVAEKIAKTMAVLHKLTFQMELHLYHTTEPEIWTKLHQWFDAASSAYAKLSDHQKQRLGFLFPQEMKTLQKEIILLEHALVKSPSPVVFSHNDSQYGNILSLPTGDIVFVDFEYSSLNYQAFDIANHFCEWAAGTFITGGLTLDYHCSEPHRMDYTKYPTKEEQLRFIRSYLEEFSPEASTEQVEKEAQVIRKQVEQFSLCSHLYWGMWGIIQAPMSNIEFDYLGYSIERFKRYFETRDAYLAQ